MSVPACLDPAHVEHRRAFWEFVLLQAEPWHREFLTRLFGVWEDANSAHFDGKLVQPIVQLLTPGTPQRYGSCAPVSGHGARSEILIRPSLLAGTHPHIDPGAPVEGRFRFVADVLLHEIVHQWQQEVSGDRDEGYHGHGPAFRDRANEIGRRLGLPPVRTCKRRGADRDLPSCSQWPHNVRPGDPYLGAYRPGREEKVCVTATGDATVVGLIRSWAKAAVNSRLDPIDMQAAAIGFLSLVEIAGDDLPHLTEADLAEAFDYGTSTLVGAWADD